MTIEWLAITVERQRKLKANYEAWGTDITKSWKNRREIGNGRTIISYDRRNEDVDYIIGSIETGKSRTLYAYFIRLDWSAGEWIEATDPRNLISALRKLATELALSGISMDCAGICDEFYESGLSVNSGWGYHPRAEGPVHMMSARP